MQAGSTLRTSGNFFKLMFMATAEREVGRNERSGSAEVQGSALIARRLLSADVAGQVLRYANQRGEDSDE